MRYFNVVIVLIIFFPVLQAETLDLDVCISEALEKSESIKGRTASIEASSYDAKSTYYNFFPSVDISYKYMKLEYYNKPDPIVLPISDPPVQFGFPLPEWQNSFEISAVQPITPLWAIDKGYSAKKMVTEIERQKLSLDSNHLKTTITELYNSYLLLDDVSKLMDDTASFLKKYKEIANNFVAEGMSDKRAVLKIDIELERVAKEKQNVAGQQSVIMTAISLFIDRDEGSFSLKPEERKHTVISKSYDDLAVIQNNNRPEIKMLKNAGKISEMISQASLSPFLPTVALALGYKNDFEATSLSPEGTFYFGGVISWDIGSDFVSNYYTYKKSRAEEVRTKFDGEASRKQMLVQLKSAYSGILVKESEIALSEKEVIEAEENLRIEENKYKEKMTTETDLLNALLNLKKANTSLISAYYNHKTALHSLANMLGVNISDISETTNNQINK